MKLSRQLLKQLIAEEKAKLNEQCGVMPSQGLMVGHEMEQGPAVQHPSYAGSGDMSMADDHSDQEGQMALSQLQQIMKNADMLKGIVSEDDELQSWVQSKLTKASDYLDSVRGFLEYEMMPNKAQAIALQEGNLSFSKNQLKQIVAEELATLSEQSGARSSATDSGVDSDYLAYRNADPYEDYFDEGGQMYDFGPDVSTRRGARQARRADRRELRRTTPREPGGLSQALSQGRQVRDDIRGQRAPGGLRQALAQGRQVRDDIRGGTGLTGLQQQARLGRTGQSSSWEPSFGSEWESDDDARFEASPHWVQNMPNQGRGQTTEAEDDQYRWDTMPDWVKAIPDGPPVEPISEQQLFEYGLAPGASLGDEGQPSPQDVLRSSIMDAIDLLKAGNTEDAIGTLEATLDAYTGSGELDSAVQDEG